MWSEALKDAASQLIRDYSKVHGILLNLGDDTSSARFVKNGFMGGTIWLAATKYQWKMTLLLHNGYIDD